MEAFFRRHAAFFFVFAALGFLFFFTIREGNDWGGDFSIYVIEARNLAEHRPFDQSSYIQTTESLVHHPGVYPPLPSLALAPVYKAYGVDLKAFKIDLVFFMWLSMPFYYALGCRRGLPRGAAAIAVLLFGLCPLLLSVEQSVGSDGIYLFVSGLTLFAIDEIHRRHWSEKHPIPSSVVAAALLVLCYLTRTTGLAVIGGFAAYELLRARRASLFWASTLAVLALVLAAYTHYAYHPGTQYGSQFNLQPAHMVSNIVGYLKVPAAIWGTAPRLPRYVISFALLMLIAGGFLRALLRPVLIEFYVAIWLGVLIGFHVGDDRYMLPLLPFFLIYAAEALIFIAGRMGARRRLVLAVCGTVAVLLSVADLRAIDRGPFREGVSQPSFADVCSFLSGRTPSNAVLLSWNPRVFALYTGKQSGLYPQTASPADFDRGIPSTGPVFIVFYSGDPDRQEVLSYLDYAGSRARQVFANTDFRVYAVETGK
jgi:hypothetical protein